MYSTIDFYEKLKTKYRVFLKPEIVSVVIVQTKDEIMLETV
ncbi:hypothetical protein [Clostridium sp. DL1XJH146]